MKHLFIFITTLLLGCLTVQAGQTVLQKNHSVMLMANDNDTIGFIYLDDKKESRFGGTVEGDTIIPRFKGYVYKPEVKNTPYYAVFQKEGDVYQSIVYEASTGHIMEINRYTIKQDQTVWEGKMEFYENGKPFYQEEYRSGVLLHTGYVDENGDWLVKFSFEPIASWPEFQEKKAISFIHYGNMAQLVRKEVYYPNHALKSTTTYRTDHNCKAVVKSVYFDINGKKKSYKPSNAVKVVQDYINSHFEYAPINSKAGAVSVLDLLIPVKITVDSTGVIRSIKLYDNIKAEHQMITGQVTYMIDKRTDVQTEVKRSYYSNNDEVQKHISDYSKHISDSMYAFMRQLDTTLVCTPEMIGDIPQASVIKATIKRDCLKKHKLKKEK